MRLLPNILKFYELNEEVKSYECPLDFNEETKEKKKKKKKENEEQQLEEFEENIEEQEDEIETEARKIIEEAKKQAEEILRQAEEEAAQMKTIAIEEGRKKGIDDGYKEGYQQAYKETMEKTQEEYQAFLKEMETIIKDVAAKKNETLQKYRQDLKNIAIAIAEKVIQISLKSSGEVIERMIIAATEKLKTKEWAKIYIAKCDADLMVEGDLDILRAISHLSNHLKVIVMENESPGTCIIELPDEIIDASANTQVENIKEILNSAGV